MNFLYPQFLYALITVLIPVIIHLFNFQRYKRIQFSNVAFLKAVKHSTQAKSTLKHLLILFARIFAIIAIVMAFAQPYIPQNSNSIMSAGQPTSIYIDNSFSMENLQEDGRLFDVAREHGYQILSTLPGYLNHQVITNNFSSAEQHLFPKEDLERQLGTKNINYNSQGLSDIFKRQQSLMNDDSFNSFIVSDFQKTQFSFTDMPSDTLINITLVPVESVAKQNLSVDSVWFDSPIHKVNTKEEIFYRIRNYSETEENNIRVELDINGSQISLANINVPAKSYMDTSFVFNNDKSGWYDGVVKIDDTPILFDNAMYFSYHIAPQIKIYSINSNSSERFISQAYNLESHFDYQESTESQVNIDQLIKSDLVILNQLNQVSSGLISALSSFLKNGGHVLIFPAVNKEINDINLFLNSVSGPTIGTLRSDSTRVSYFDYQSPIYKNVFNSKSDKINLPDIYRYYNLINEPLNATHLLTTPSKDVVLASYPIERGNLYLSTVPLNKQYTNFGKHSIFLPTLFEIAFASGTNYQMYYDLEKDKYIEYPYLNFSERSLIHIRNKSFNTDFVPEVIPRNNHFLIGIHDNISMAGIYNLVKSDSIIGKVAYNYSRKESNPSSYSLEEIQFMVDSLNRPNISVLKSDIENFRYTLEKQNMGIELWKWFLMLALLFLGIEILLIRFFKPSVL